MTSTSMLGRLIASAASLVLLGLLPITGSPALAIESGPSIDEKEASDWAEGVDRKGNEYLEFQSPRPNGSLAFRVYRKAAGIHSTVTVVEGGSTHVYKQVAQFLPNEKLRVKSFDPDGELIETLVFDNVVHCGCEAIGAAVFAYCSADPDPTRCVRVTVAGGILCGLYQFICTVPPEAPCSRLDFGFQGVVTAQGSTGPIIFEPGDTVRIVGQMLRPRTSYRIDLYPDSATTNNAVIGLAFGTTGTTGEFIETIVTPNVIDAHKGTLGIFCVRMGDDSSPSHAAANFQWRPGFIPNP